MILINQPTQMVQEYAKKSKINKSKIFFFKQHKQYDFLPSVEYIEYSDIIMYKYFYRLLEEIDESTLIIVDNCIRTLKRNDLTYNCLKHYLNQTNHRIILSDFPFIEDKSDFMILMDLNNPDKYKMRKFEYELLQQEDVRIQKWELSLKIHSCGTDDKQLKKYNLKRDYLFENLGGKEVETIPRALQLLAGDYKKNYISPDIYYIARNKRFNLENVVSYNEDYPVRDYWIIDTHYSRMHFLDYIRKCNVHDINYLSTQMTIDKYIVDDINSWINRLEEFYEEASVHTSERARLC